MPLEKAPREVWNQSMIASTNWSTVEGRHRHYMRHYSAFTPCILDQTVRIDERSLRLNQRIQASMHPKEKGKST
jgi:hypothetical protein